MKVKLHTGNPAFESPSAFGLYKTSGGQALGVVGKDFTPTQPEFLWNNLKACLVAKEIDDTKMKFREIKGGRKIVITCPVKEFSFKNKAKKNDIMSVMVAISTGYDGKTPTQMFLHTERLICTNGMKALDTEFTVKFKNVKGNIGKANMLCDDVADAISDIDNLKDLYTKLNQRTITPKEQAEYIKMVTGLDPRQYADLTKKRQALLDTINESVAIEMKDAGETAWALMNGITRYTNHGAKYTSKDDYLFADAGMFMNNRAQRAAIQLLN